MSKKIEEEFLSLDELRDKELSEDEIPEYEENDEDALNMVRTQGHFSADGHSWNGHPFVNYLFNEK